MWLLSADILRPVSLDRPSLSVDRDLAVAKYWGLSSMWESAWYGKLHWGLCLCLAQCS